MSRRMVVITAGVLVALTAAYMLAEGWMTDSEIKYAALMMFVSGVALALIELRTRREQ